MIYKKALRYTIPLPLYSGGHDTLNLLIDIEESVETIFNKMSSLLQQWFMADACMLRCIDETDSFYQKSHTCLFLIALVISLKGLRISIRTLRKAMSDLRQTYQGL